MAKRVTKLHPPMQRFALSLIRANGNTTFTKLEEAWSEHKTLGNPLVPCDNSNNYAAACACLRALETKGLVIQDPKSAPHTFILKHA